jgi:hypothetical protein
VERRPPVVNDGPEYQSLLFVGDVEAGDACRDWVLRVLLVS